MNKEWFMRFTPIILAALIIVAIVVVIRSFELPKNEKHTIVGAVLVGSKIDLGWNSNHYDGLVDACDKNGCKLLIRDNVPEQGQAVIRAVKSMIDEGANVIFLSSFGYGDYAGIIARDNPDVAFFCISGQGTEKNRATYFGRIYQARYLAGIVAGCESKTGILGFVSSMLNSQTNQSINAFALGMRTANPNARLLVRFTGSWDDQVKERESVRFLASKGADVITYHEDKPYAVREAEALGLYSIGYDSVYEQFSERFLTAAVYDWKIIYGKLLGDYLSGRAHMSDTYWFDFYSGGVKLYPLSHLVSKDTRLLLEREQDRIVKKRDVFSGVIYDNEGKLRCAEDETISDRELFTGMEWYAEGVEIYE